MAIGDNSWWNPTRSYSGRHLQRLSYSGWYKHNCEPLDHPPSFSRVPRSGQVRARKVFDSKTREPEFDFDHQSKIEDGSCSGFLERYGIDLNDDKEDGGLVLVRPDLYVGLSCWMGDAKAVLEHLKQWYAPNHISPYVDKLIPEQQRG